MSRRWRGGRRDDSARRFREILIFAQVRLIRGSLDRNEPPPPGEAIREIQPVAGTLLLFDSVAVPHEVLAVTAERPRVACTGWFHELLPAP